MTRLITFVLAFSLSITPIAARVTAYSPFDNQSGMCADEDPSVTSTGVRPGPMYIAVDPKRIPYGSRVYIPGYGMAIAADTGGALRRYRGVAIDVYKETYREMRQWGKQYLTVVLVEEGADDDIGTTY